MAKYIEREELVEWMKRIPLKDLSDGLGLCRVIMEEDFKRAIRTIPAGTIIDVAPVVHGRWDDSGRYTFPGGSTAVRCTNCGCALTKSEYRLNNWNYCPVCGAKMDGGATCGLNAGSMKN